MNYFDTLPQILVSDFNGNNIVATNLLTRAELIPALAKNPVLFYQYDIQDGDTPEIIADKYYGDSYRYWIVLFGNQIMDPQWNWPMTQNLFQSYLYDKYASAAAAYYSIPVAKITLAQVTAYTQLTIQNYVKQVVSVDNISLTTTTDNYYISQGEYNSLQTGSNTYNFPDGSSCTVTISKYTQSIYDFEVAENEAKRSINLLNNTYANQLEYQLTSNLSA